MRIAIDWAKRGRELAILVAIGTFLAIVEPYGATSRMEFWQGWLYWVGLIIYGSVIGWNVSHYTMKWFPNFPGWAYLIIISSVCSLAVATVLILLDLAFDGRTTVGEFFLLYGFVWVISAAVTGIGLLLHMIEKAKESAGSGASEGGPAIDPVRQFMSRLPIPYRNAELYAIASEDHYLRIYTSAGEHMFLERLANAIRELEGSDGMQTHRSWWVASDGIKEAKTVSGRIVLILKTGTEVPVSRTYAPEVRKAGWV